ncbi:T9SS type A sorting domain-containing protein [bacterium]|nr:T9SS type A sorting domain-containing protein [bacterium]
MPDKRQILILILLTFWLLPFACLYAQDSTFTIEEAYRIELPDSANAIIETADLTWDGVKEIVAVVNYSGSTHKVHIYRSGELIHTTEPRDRWENNHCIICDFNRDGRRDIVFEICDYHLLEVYYGYEYDLSLSEPYYYGSGKVRSGGDRILEDGSTIPLITTNLLHSQSYEDDDSTSVEMWSYAQVWQGTWLEGRPEMVTEVCNHTKFLIRDNGQTGSDLFVAGSNIWILDVEGVGEFDTTYYQLFTNYGRDFSEPDSLTLFYGVTVDENDKELYWFFGFSNNNAVEDFNNDGNLDWALCYWEETGQDTYSVHLAVYNPLNFELIGEYVEEEITDIYVDPMRGPAPALGVAAVDIDDDGIWELLLGIQNRPLRLIDPRTMEAIASSEFVLPDIRTFTFEVGRFGEDGRLQLMIEDYYYVYGFYDLPEEWTAPNSAPNPEPEFPCEFTLFAAYPNPFNSATTITYGLDKSAPTRLALYDLTGREVLTLYEGFKQAGCHTATLTAGDLASGLYFMRLNAGGFRQSRKIVLFR